MSEKLMKKPALGRGLSALLSQAEDTYGTGVANAKPAEAAAPQNGLRKVSIHHLQPGKYQPRQRFNAEAITQLAESIKAHGLLQPILTRQLASGALEIIAGERRWRAAQEAHLHEVPVLVQDFTDAQALEIGLIENLQRQDLNALEEADAYQRLMDEFGHTQQKLAEVIGKSRSHIANTLRLLSLPEAVRTMVITERLTPGHARALLNVKNAAEVAQYVIDRGLSVRETEKLISSAAAGLAKSPKAGAKPPQQSSADVKAIETDLSQRLGLKVEIAVKGAGGSCTVHFKSLDQFDDLLAKLTRSG